MNKKITAIILAVAIVVGVGEGVGLNKIYKNSQNKKVQKAPQTEDIGNANRSEGIDDLPEPVNE